MYVVKRLVKYFPSCASTEIHFIYFVGKLVSFENNGRVSHRPQGGYGVVTTLVYHVFKVGFYLGSSHMLEV
jgi:hypothetical protein